MVNVNTQVSSSMELPFGEYTPFCVCVCVFNQLCSAVSVRKGRVWQLLAVFSFSFRWFVQQPFGSRALLDHV